MCEVEREEKKKPMVFFFLLFLGDGRSRASKSSSPSVGAERTRGRFSLSCRRGNGRCLGKSERQRGRFSTPTIFYFLVVTRRRKVKKVSFFFSFVRVLSFVSEPNN